VSSQANNTTEAASAVETRWHVPAIIAAIAILALGACGHASRSPGGGLAVGSDASAVNPSDVDLGGEQSAAIARGRIAIYIAGDLSQAAFEDALAGQTPTDYEIAVSRYYTLTSANDPAPQLCFDHGDRYVIAKMHGDNLVGSCPTDSIRTAAYTHGGTKVEWTRYTVEGVYHVLGQDLPGKLSVFRAFSNTSYRGQSYAAGQGYLRVSGPTEREIPVVFPPLPDAPGVQFEIRDGEFFFTFVYSEPLLIEQHHPGQHWARFHWMIRDSFRWADRPLPGYAPGVWDLSPNPLASESISRYGVSGYYVTSSQR
jgi:hypothetical protein